MSFGVQVLELFERQRHPIAYLADQSVGVHSLTSPV
jgi:hypothetical protein